MSGIENDLLEDADAAARAAARRIAGWAREAVAERGVCLAAFSGGRTPRTMLGALVTQSLPWRELHVFQVDERVAPRGSADRNLTQIEETLLGNTPLASDQIHAMPVDEGGGEDAADAYARLLASLGGTPPVLDFVHLGLGDDGHTASLVPGDPVLDVTDRNVAMTGPYQGRRRMTLTYPIINRARRRLWLVTGAGKAEMLIAALVKGSAVPAARVSRDRTVLFYDRAAAGLET